MLGQSQLTELLRAGQPSPCAAPVLSRHGCHSSSSSLCLSECLFTSVFFSLLSLDESDYQTEYEEEVLDSQKDDYVNFISSQVDEDSDSVRAALAIGCAVGTRSRCQEGLLREARRGVLRKTVQQLFCAVQALKDTCCSGGQSAAVPCGANVATLCEEPRAFWVWSQGGSGLGRIRHEEDEGAASFSLEEKRPRGDLPAVFSCLELGA